MAVGAAFLAKIKLAAGITASIFDTDITDLIESARSEMIRTGVDPAIAASETDALVRLAIRTKIQSEYAENEAEAVRLAASFASQSAALSMSTRYRAESSEVVVYEV